jgi:hypothetical protein
MRSVIDHHPPILLRGTIVLFAVASAFLHGTVAVAQSGWLPSSAGMPCLMLGCSRRGPRWACR